MEVMYAGGSLFRWDVCLCGCEVGLRTSETAGERANGKGGEMGPKTEENDEKVVARQC